MSQPSKKRDIADYFRPHAKVTPRKRPTPEPDGGTIVVNLGGSGPKTPSTDRTLKYNLLEGQKPPTFDLSAHKPLATPRSDRRLSIPIRSPAGTTVTSTKRTQPVSQFHYSRTARGTTPKPSSSFSFVDAPGTSRNVRKDGKLVEVRDSDDDDNDSLASLTDLFDRKKNEPPAENSSQADALANDEEEGAQLLGLVPGARSNPVLKRDKIRELQRREQANKISLAALLEEDRKDEERRAAIAKATTELEAATREIEESEQADLDRQRLAAILQGTSENVDQDELERLMEAVDRTEALSTENTFSFFGRSGPTSPALLKKKRKDFPSAAIPASLWKPEDSAARERAYRAGFVTELAGRSKFSHEGLRWTFDSILAESQDDLRQIYINTVSAASASWTRSNVTPEDIQNIFNMLGADAKALDDRTPIETRRQLRRDDQRPDYKCLCVTLKLFHTLCQDMDFACLSKLTSVVSRLVLDQEVMNHHLVSQAAENLLEKLVNLPDPDSLQHVHERLVADLTTNLPQPQLQALFLKHFVPTTLPAATLRQRLACEFIFGCQLTQEIFQSGTNPSSLQVITRIVDDNPYFTAKRSKTELGSTESFSTLSAMTRILDIAISDGYIPSTFASRADEQDFDADVDALAEQIHDLFSSIADSGASHMRRTEAKDLLQALHSRLLYGVRTKPRRRRHVFDVQGTFSPRKKKVRIRDAFDVEYEGKGRDFMSKFFERQSMNDTDVLDEVRGRSKVTDGMVDMHDT